MRIKFIQNTIDFLRGKKSIKKALKKYRQNKRQKALIAKYLNDSKCLIIYPPQGLGDILYICLLLSEYKKLFGKKILMIVRKAYFAQLARLFYEEVDEILFEPDYENSLIKAIKLDKKALNIENLLYERGMKWESFRINLCKILNLNPNSRLYTTSKFKFEANFDFTFKQGKTIVFSPHATSCPKCVPDEFWCEWGRF